MASEHDLKIDVQPMDDLLSGEKTGEVRNDDRGFEVGDIVHLTCVDGRTAERRISHIQRGYGLPEGICVLSYSPTPVAPVSPDATGKCGELETIAYENKRGMLTEEKEDDASEDLVYRSQAAELLAAERAKKEMLAESLHIQIKRVNALEADNASLTTRVKELKKELENGGRVKGVNTQYANALAYLEMTEDDDPEEFAKRIWDELKALEAKLAVAEKALKTARPYVEDYDTRRHNTGVDETLTQIDAALGGKPS